MVILDSDILIGYLRNVPEAVSRVQQLQKNNSELKTTIFNIAELKKGCYLMKNVAKGLLSLERLISSLHGIELFNFAAMEEFTKISADLQNRGSMIGIMDELIASICIAMAEPIVSRNIKHFIKIPNLTCEEW